MENKVSRTVEQSELRSLFKMAGEENTKQRRLNVGYVKKYLYEMVAIEARSSSAVSDYAGCFQGYIVFKKRSWTINHDRRKIVFEIYHERRRTKG